MKISLGVYPNRAPAEIIRMGRIADGLGFETLWMLDSHLLFHEVYTLLGALAVSTQRIRLGTAVTNPLTRHPTITASAFATLAALSGGRASLGISIGDSALRAMKLKIAKLDTLADTVRKCRSLLRGDAVVFNGSATARLRHIGPQVPIYIAASAPRMLRLAGELGDGVILMNGVAPELIHAAVELVRDGERHASRPRGSTKVVAWAACHPDPEAVKFNVARAILRNIPGPADELTRQTASEVSKAYDYEEHGDAEAKFSRLIPDELVPRYAFSGSTSAIAQQIEALGPLGVDEVALAIPSSAHIKPPNLVIQELAPLLPHSAI
jgi:5,10-methylenetetrahydromethanopterin reductase